VPAIGPSFLPAQRVGRFIFTTKDVDAIGRRKIFGRPSISFRLVDFFIFSFIVGGLARVAAGQECPVMPSQFFSTVLLSLPFGGNRSDRKKI
jgi:hypothetical protein